MTFFVVANHSNLLLLHLVWFNCNPLLSYVHLDHSCPTVGYTTLITSQTEVCILKQHYRTTRKTTKCCFKRKHLCSADYRLNVQVVRVVKDSATHQTSVWIYLLAPAKRYIPSSHASFPATLFSFWDHRPVTNDTGECIYGHAVMI